jgi:hypothetical protein
MRAGICSWWPNNSSTWWLQLQNFFCSPQDAYIRWALSGDLRSAPLVLIVLENHFITNKYMDINFLGVLFCAYIYIKSIKTNCNGEYINVDPNNTACINDLNAVTEVIKRACSKKILLIVFTGINRTDLPFEICSASKRYIQQIYWNLYVVICPQNLSDQSGSKASETIL